MTLCPVDYEGVLIPGSLSDAHDETTKWIQNLKRFIVEKMGADTNKNHVPTVGICFGHQILAKALGGMTQRNPEGGIVGMCELFSENKEQKGLSLVCSHNDVVTRLPKNAVALSEKSFVELASYKHHETKKTWARTIQAHPEYDEHQLRSCATCFLNGDIEKVNQIMGDVNWAEVERGSHVFWDETLQELFF
ncbi:hypothetical protein ScalyP_jg5396 [Parmales sp. scaly parma]|nr:hypothetical protein ScalyP_jg5396 [Parmales sp. scaly parma]